MKTFLVVCCLIAVAASQTYSNIVVEYLDNGSKVCKQLIPGVPLAQCPPSNCPEIPGDVPEANANCGMPDCRLFISQSFLWPSVDPNFFYQCRPIVGGWEALRRPCGCMTLFDHKLQRCVHPEEFKPLCNGSPANPIPKPCPKICLDCDGNEITGSPSTSILPPLSTLPQVGPTLPPATSTLIPSTNAPNNCQCPCSPCIWWPCQPCPNNCACNQG